MNQDLRWLAEHLDKWKELLGAKETLVRRNFILNGPEFISTEYYSRMGAFTRQEWQAARDDFLAPEIGIVESFLGSPFSTPEEDEAFAAIEKKQKRYQDAQGEDWIDEAARTFTAEEFRGAMRFTLGKYVRRAGKKDALESEIEKIRDYAARWLEVEKGR